MDVGGFTTLLSPDACLTAIDAAMWEAYTREEQPGYLKASDSFFFKQDTLDKIAFIWDEDSNIGAYQVTGEQEEILNSDTFVGNTKTKRSLKYTKQIPVSDEAFRADYIGKRAQIGKQLGDRARMTQDRETLLDTYADAFAGSINTTPDGQALASNTHTTLKGFTVDNLETGAFSPDNAWTLTQSLANQAGQDGDTGSHLLEGVLSPFILYKTTKEVLNSVLLAGGALNNLNIFDTDYGNVQIRASVFLNSAVNKNSNANTSYHFIGRNHMITRKTFYDLTSTMIYPEYTANDSYIMRSKFHEAHLNGSWTAYVGSNGTT